jgi:serine/threonine protein kinase
MMGMKLANRYDVVRELGRGGMGVVYLAKDPLLDREVAVKMIHAGALSDEHRLRFVREARVVAKMDHTAIVSVFDMGEHEGSLFLVMPFVPGLNLRESSSSWRASSRKSPAQRRSSSSSRICTRRPSPSRRSNT